MFRDIFTTVSPTPSLYSPISVTEENLIELHDLSSLPDLSEVFTACDAAAGTLSALHQKLTALPFSIVDAHWHWVTSLDLSHNFIEDVSFIVYFESLHTLVLDHNLVNSRTTFPLTPKLETLWLNYNQVHTLFPLAERLSAAFPRLRYLSMMGNPGVPSVVNGGTFHDYIVYRMSLLSRVTSLTYLDDREVDEDEKEDAAVMFPNKKNKKKTLNSKNSEETKPFKHMLLRAQKKLEHWLNFV